MANLDELERTLKAFGNKRRLAVVQFLKGRKGGASVGEIASAIRLSFKSTSHHLRLLRSAGILDRDQRSIEATFTLSSSLSKVARGILNILS